MALNYFLHHIYLVRVLVALLEGLSAAYRWRDRSSFMVGRIFRFDLYGL